MTGRLERMTHAQIDERFAQLEATLWWVGWQIVWGNIARQVCRAAGIDPVKHYDPKQVRVTWGDVELTGFADGSDIMEAEPDPAPEPRMSAHVGGSITMTLMSHRPAFTVREWVFSLPRSSGYKAQKRRARMARKRRRGWA